MVPYKWPKLGVATLSLSALVVSATTINGTNAFGSDSECSTQPSNVSVTADSTLNDEFASYGNATTGENNSGTGLTWTGGDGTQSIALPNGTELWMFSDTYFGAVNTGLRLMSRSPMVHNTFLLQDPEGHITDTLYTVQEDNDPSAYINPVLGKDLFLYAFWPGGSTISSSGNLDVLLPEYRSTTQAFHFDWLQKLDVGVFELPSLRLVALYPIASNSVNWSNQVLTQGQNSYIYGNANGKAYVALAPAGHITDQANWRYWDGSGWMTDQASAAPIASDLGRSYSVSRLGNGTYVLIHSAPAFANKIYASFGCSPSGPFDDTADIFNPPEPKSYPATFRVYTYDAHAHDELTGASTPNALVVSYDVDAYKSKIGMSHVTVYRPRFLDVSFGFGSSSTSRQ